MSLAKPTSTTCIVIPCYNEEKGFQFDKYRSFLKKQSDVLLCFVNDGSTDDTFIMLTKFKEEFPKLIEVVDCAQNQGKAEAVRTGMHHCEKHFEYTFIGYLDADLSTSLEECAGMKSYLEAPIAFSFGCRMMKIGSIIERNRYRFIIGRIIATVISRVLDLRVYDTQCGCKLFKRELAVYVFKEAFISKWLFDVELFYRIINRYGKEAAIEKMIEIPLKKWVDEGDSKVKTSYFFRLWFDLYAIHKKYKQK
tara:strand:+ start:2104 stop:2856 length:753 start_codon:yes stop_codon:yes gene_type:complete